MKKNQGKKQDRVGLNIRFEVLSIINKNPLRSVKLPSAAVLAEKFSISHRSVTLELKKLTDEGWIYGVQGVGSFTNPQKILSTIHQPSNKVIGIICGDSRKYYYDYNMWAWRSHIGMNLVPEIGYPCDVSLTCNGPDGIAKEILSSGMDGVIWICPPKYAISSIQEIAKKKFPVVTVIDNLPSIPSITVDYIQCGRDLAAALSERPHKKILWCAYDSYVQERMKGATEVLGKKWYSEDKMLVSENNAEFEEKLRELIERDEIPDTFYLHGTSFYVLLDIFKEYGLDPYDNRWTLIAGWSIVKNIQDFNGIVRKYPYEEIGRAAAQIMKKLFYDPKKNISAGEKLKMEVFITRKNTIAPNR